MDIGSIFLILGLLVLVGLFVARPFFEHPAPTIKAEQHQFSSLLAERDQILNALQELDFDYALNKIPEGDYPGQRAALVTRGAQILRELDNYQAQGPASAAAEERIEAAIAARRADAAGLQIAGVPNGKNGGSRVSTGTPDDDLERLLASRRRQRSEKAAGFCPQCGGALQKSDRFCPKCGHSIA